EVAGVEAEPLSQRAQVGAGGADLPQQPRLAERTIAGQEAIVERADPLGHHAVESTHLFDRGLIHSLTIVKEWGDASRSAVEQEQLEQIVEVLGLDHGGIRV